jgi:hypothetical protein
LVPFCKVRYDLTWGSKPVWFQAQPLSVWIAEYKFPFGMYLKFGLVFRCSSHCSVSEEHLMGPCVSVSVTFTTMGPEVPLLGDSRIQGFL